MTPTTHKAELDGPTTELVLPDLEALREQSSAASRIALALTVRLSQGIGSPDERFALRSEASRQTALAEALREALRRYDLDAPSLHAAGLVDAAAVEVAGEPLFGAAHVGQRVRASESLPYGDGAVPEGSEGEVSGLGALGVEVAWGGLDGGTLWHSPSEIVGVSA